MKIQYFSTLLYFLFLGISSVLAQSNIADLKYDLSNNLQSFKGEVGISVRHIEMGDSFHMLNEVKFPMLSVYKLPLAIKVLHDIDEGLYTSEKKVFVSRDQLRENTWSPMKKSYGDSSFVVTVETLLNYAIAYSDNIACDVLFQLTGGPAAVEKFLKSQGVTGIFLSSTEKQIHRKPDLVYHNYCHPSAMNELLLRLYSKTIISASSTDLLIKMMTSSETGANRLMKKLPENARVAHKTGTGVSDELIIACNDVGILTLPDGNHILISVFIKDSPEPYEVCESAIADIADRVYTYYSSGSR